jgi:hypothetical protein
VPTMLRARRRDWVASAVSGVLTAAVVFALLAGASTALAPTARADDPLPVSSSAVELSTAADDLDPATAPMPDLKVRVSQTRDLVSQGIQISWTGGGAQSGQPNGNVGGTNFLQVFQCWGEDPDNPGHPDRRTCQYGGTGSWGAMRDGNRPLEAVATKDAPYSADIGGIAYTAIPFVAVNADHSVDEKTAPADKVLSNIATAADGKTSIKPDKDLVDLSTNQFLTSYTTNEIKWAPSGAGGAGSVPFEVQTAMQSQGLGCGAPVAQADGTFAGQSCWLVILPRGTADNGSSQIDTPGLWWDSWKHHLAVKLEFKPIGVRCEIGQAERQLAGSELIAGAIAAWQPKLCAGQSGAPFVLNQSNEADTLVQAASTTPSALALTSRPLDTSRIGDAADPLAYAPVAVAGVSITFAVDRQPHPQNATKDEKSRSGLPLTDLRLTPRLLAKLLTASYVEALPAGADKKHIGFIDFSRPGKNARTLTADPEFLEVNDKEWAAQLITTVSVADALQPQGRSDLAQRVWEYILADRDARDWLAGKPDPWGMIVNPWYATDAAVNPTQEGLALPMNSFPKADPSERADSTTSDPANGTGPVNLVTWRPYTNDFSQGAYDVLRGDGLTLGGWDRFATPPKFSKGARQLLGTKAVIALTTTPAAALYQTVNASLRNPAGQFVAPSRNGLAAAAAAMTATSARSDVVQFDPHGDAAKAAKDAYPLTMPVYAALNPAQSDAAQRAVYANFIRYAARDGQVSGTDVGQLPPGYAPLPQAWVEQALRSADLIERGPAAPGSTSGAPAAAAPLVAPPSPVVAPAAAVAADGAVDPAAAGAAAGSLAGAVTPADPDSGALAVAVPGGLLAGVGAAFLTPVLGRLGRRRLS